MSIIQSGIYNSSIYSDNKRNPNVLIYSMNLTGGTSFNNEQQLFYISATTNTFDTALRSTSPQFSVSVWCKPMGTQNSNVGGGLLFSKWDTGNPDMNQILGINVLNEVVWNANYLGTMGPPWNGVQKRTTPIINTGTTWYNIVITYDYSQTTIDTIAKMYVNGSEITVWNADSASTTNKYFYNQTNSALRATIANGAGQTPDSFGDVGGTSFIGRLSEVTYWTTALTASEVMQIYTGTSTNQVVSMSSYGTYCCNHYKMGNDAGDVFTADGNWVIKDVKGGVSTNLNSSGLTFSALVEDAP